MFVDTAAQFSKVILPSYIPNRNVWKFPLIYTFNKLDAVCQFYFAQSVGCVVVATFHIFEE